MDPVTDTINPSAVARTSRSPACLRSVTWDISARTSFSEYEKAKAIPNPALAPNPPAPPMVIRLVSSLASSVTGPWTTPAVFCSSDSTVYIVTSTLTEPPTPTALSPRARPKPAVSETVQPLRIASISSAFKSRLAAPSTKALVSPVRILTPKAPAMPALFMYDDDLPKATAPASAPWLVEFRASTSKPPPETVIGPLSSTYARASSSITCTVAEPETAIPDLGIE